MRATLTIDDDIAKLLHDEVRRSGGNFKRTVNRLLLDSLTKASKPARRKKFVVTPLELNLSELGFGTKYTKVEELLDALDGPLHR